MQVAGLREFRSRATQLLGGKDLVFVTKHGKVTSLVVPMGDAETLPIELRRELLASMGRSISAHLKDQGVSEAKVLKDFKAWKKVRHAASR